MGDGKTEGGSNSILSLTGIEARLAKLEGVIEEILPAASKGIVSVGTDVAAIAGEIGAVIAAPTLINIAGVIVPISSAAMDFINVIESLANIIKNPPATPSVGTLTGSEVAGPNAAKS